MPAPLLLCVPCPYPYPQVPHLKMPPHPFQPNTWHLQAHEPVTQRLHETLEAMIAQMDRAIDVLPDLTNKLKPTKRRLRA
jgi:hypothetical protein